MKFLQQLTFYCLLAGTGFLAFNYIYAAIFKVSGNNPYLMKQLFALASLLVLYILYKSFQVGELSSNYLGGIKWVLISWIPYIIVTIGYLVLAKLQGRI
jgi:membrane protein CcdC involved in cytochrome C biogenesis